MKEISQKHDELMKKLDDLIQNLSETRKKPSDPFFSNEEFMELMSLSVRTAQLWRDTELISYSQISGKIYYRLSDIQKLLDDNYHKSIKTARKKS
ncbi:MAG: DNA-binding protein [Paludibacter sp.]